ncbi:MAG: hypothetical protein IJ180_03095 [Bacteroidales bacterium]|nr:hypothetical protein [Bacteroidales bacterium]
MKKVLVFAFFAIIFASSNVFSQRFAGFSGNNDKYISELEELYKTDANMNKEQKKEWESLIQVYDSVWNTFNSTHKRDIVKLSQLMLKKNIRARNGFYQFLQTQVAFTYSNQSAESYNQWLKGMQKYLSEHNIKIYNDAMVATYNLLSKNCIYLSNQTKWSFDDNARYIFREDTARGVYADFSSPINLTYATKKDSNTIYNTIGKVFLMEGQWEGENGVVNWQKAGLNPDSVFVNLKKYNVILKSPGFMADSVIFTNKEYFSHTLEGSFEDVCTDKAAGTSKYPQFNSYKREEIIKNIFQDVDYVGGFTQQGGRFLGTGSQKEPARLVFYKEGKVFMVAKAIAHPFSRDGIITQDCQVTFYVQEDSIYHPGLKMNYNKSTRQILCSDNKVGISASPWIDSYHAIDIYTEAVYTGLGEHTIEFTSIKGPSKKSFATFESNNYYSDMRWYKIQGVDEISPLYRVKAYTDKYGKEQFTVKQFSKFTGLDITQCKLLLMNLSLNGFMSYESYRETAIVKEKLYDYIKANQKRKDYDALRFLSSTTDGEANAVLNIYDMDLRLSGVETFSLSDSHSVAITPLNGKMVMQKNRDFSFDGSIAAGRFRMAGVNCKFSYKDFLIDLPQLDSMRFFVPSFNDTNTLVMIQTPIQNLQCQMVIDSSNNKSSIKKIDGYPMLTSLKNSYVYYDYPHIQKGVYYRDNFYYELEPFVIKNMFSFKTDSLKLKGTLKSAGIFPDIDEKLVVMRDYSLGFKKDLDAKGLPVYGGKATYHNSIDLSCNGLLGTGEFVYGASKSISKMFIFHPDSMFCSTEKFDYTSPEVHVTKTAEHMYPHLDYMIVEQKAEPFNMYASNNSNHKGYLKVTSSSLMGSGENKTNEMIVVADDFKYYPDSYTSDSATFTLLSLDGNSVAFKANNVKANVSLKARKGEFTAKSGLQKNELPYLEYECFVDRFSWDMNEKLLSLQNSSSTNGNGFESKDINDIIDLEQPGAEFVSVHPSQNNLSFHAVNAKLNLNTNELNADGVYLIKSADAAIKPEPAKIVLHPGAQMDTIEKATIVFNMENRMHRVYDARVHVASSNLYSANGYIDFKDADGKKAPIFFKEITSATGYSVGYADILKENALNLSPAFKFYGEVSVVAPDSLMSFNGGVTLALNCSDKEYPYLKFKSRLDPTNIEIPINEAPVDVEGNRITTSILFDENNLKPIIAFFTSDKEADNVFIKAQGFLTYDKKSNEYRIASKEKLADMENVVGDYLSINKSNCKAKGQGNIQLGLPLGGVVKTNNYGEIKASSGTDENVNIRMTLALNFPFSVEALDVMGRNMADDMNLSEIDFEKSRYRNFLHYLYGEEKGEDLFLDLVEHGDWEKIPDKINYTILLPDVSLNWDPVRNSYLALSDAEVGMIGKNQVNRKMKTRIQMIKSGISTEIRIYLEQDIDNWYYFAYNGASMSAISSDENFNDYVKNSKNKEFKGENGKIYTFRLATENDKRKFIRNIELMQYEDDED